LTEIIVLTLNLVINSFQELVLMEKHFIVLSRF